LLFLLFTSTLKYIMNFLITKYTANQFIEFTI